MNLIFSKKDHVIVWDKSGFCIKEIKREPFVEDYEKVAEAKKIAAQVIGCEFVDGLNLIIDDKYYSGIYCDDLAKTAREQYFVFIKTFPYSRKYGISITNGKLWLLYRTTN